jgi:hypothetical protein
MLKRLWLRALLAIVIWLVLIVLAQLVGVI